MTNIQDAVDAGTGIPEPIFIWIMTVLSALLLKREVSLRRL